MLDTVPWFLPGATVSAVLGLFLWRPVARLLGTSQPVAWLLLFGLGCTFSATLTPINPGIDRSLSGVGSCDFDRLALAPLDALMRINDTSLNVALFVPLGLAIGWLPRSWRKIFVILFAIVMPVGIEIVQMMVPGLARGCESADVIDNVTGLVIGLIGGTVMVQR